MMFFTIILKKLDVVDHSQKNIIKFSNFDCKQAELSPLLAFKFLTFWKRKVEV